MNQSEVRSKITFYLSDGTSEVEYCEHYPSSCSELLQNQPYRRRIIQPLVEEEQIWKVINLDNVVKYTVQAYSFPVVEVPPTEGGTV